MLDKKLILTVGLPKSGKSIWAKQQGCPVVNRDDIRLVLHGHRYIQESEEFITAIETLMVRYFFLQGHKKVIVDATHITEDRLHRWKNDKEWERETIVFNVDEKTCIDRAVSEGDFEIIPIIKSMAKNLIITF